VTPDLAVDPDRLRGHADVLWAHRELAAKIRAAAVRADVDPVLWGPVGARLGLPERYRELSDAVHHHLDETTRFLGAAADRMADTARRYARADADSALHLDALHLDALHLDALHLDALHLDGLDVDELDRQVGGRVPAIDLRDLHRAVPVSGVIEKGAAAARSGQYGEAVASCLELGVADYTLVTDPLGFLCSAGLSFLVSVVQPLEDLLGLVTGNGDRIGRDAQAWQVVADQLAGMAASIDASVAHDLPAWTGATSGAARERLRAFASGVRGLSAEVAELVALLNSSRTGMDAARSLILEIIAALVEWLVVTWLAAQAASVVSLGTSEVAAMSATLLETEHATLRAAVIVRRVEVAFGKVEGAFACLARKVLDNLPERLAGGAVREARETVAEAAGRAAERAAERIAARAGADGLGPAMQHGLGQAYRELTAAAGRHAVLAALRDGLTGGAVGAGLTTLGGVLDGARERPPPPPGDRVGAALDPADVAALAEDPPAPSIGPGGIPRPDSSDRHHAGTATGQGPNSAYSPRLPR